MELPKERRQPLGTNPLTLIIYSAPKTGKTVICAGLKDGLILELEPNGANFVEGRVLEINKPSEFIEALKLLKDSKEQVCEHLIIDTITKWDEWSEIVGTFNYMNKPQGQRFNRIDDIPNGTKILHTDARFESVHELGQGYGYKHSRDVMTTWYDEIVNLIPLGKVKYVIFISHIKDKLIESRKGDLIESSDLNLTGKVKSIYCSRVDAVGHLYRKGTQCFLNFDNEHKTISGGRCIHLNSEILISEKQKDGSIKTFWENVYLPEAKQQTTK